MQCESAQVKVQRRLAIKQITLHFLLVSLITADSSQWDISSSDTLKASSNNQESELCVPTAVVHVKQKEKQSRAEAAQHKASGARARQRERERATEMLLSYNIMHQKAHVTSPTHEIASSIAALRL